MIKIILIIVNTVLIIIFLLSFINYIKLKYMRVLNTTVQKIIMILKITYLYD